MAKLTLPLLSLEARGSLGGVLSFDKRSGQHRVRAKPTPTDPHSLAQIYQRWLYQDYIFWWHELTPTQKQQWESDARRLRITGFNYWMRIKLTTLPDVAAGYRLDGITDAIVKDFSLNANHGTVFGALLVDGVIDKCLWFDGTDDLVDLGNDPSLMPTTNRLTMEAIVTPFETTKGHIFYKDGAYILRVDGLLDAYVYIVEIGNWIQARAACNLNQPNHILATWDGDFLSIYHNGIFATKTASLGNTLNQNPGAHTYLGARNVAGLQGFHGSIDQAILNNQVIPGSLIPVHAARHYP